MQQSTDGIKKITFKKNVLKMYEKNSRRFYLHIYIYINVYFEYEVEDLEVQKEINKKLNFALMY